MLFLGRTRSGVCGNDVEQDEANHDDKERQDVKSGELRTGAGNELRAACAYHCCSPKPTLYWKRKMPQKRLKRSAVSSDRLTAVALVAFTTLGMKLYSATMLKT